MQAITNARILFLHIAVTKSRPLKCIRTLNGNFIWIFWFVCIRHVTGRSVILHTTVMLIENFLQELCWRLGLRCHSGLIFKKIDINYQKVDRVWKKTIHGRLFKRHFGQLRHLISKKWSYKSIK